MNHLLTVIGIGSLTVLGSCLPNGSLFSPSSPAQTSPAQTMASSSPRSTCNRSPIQSALRIWTSPIPHTPTGQAALPPGTETPPPQPKGAETHALHLELQLINESRESQSVHVTTWSWSQADQKGQEMWNVQPNMSPLNRYSQVQRQLLELTHNEPLQVEMSLEMNGHLCQLQAQTTPEIL